MGMEPRELPVLMQDLGEGEDHLPVREPQQQPLVHVLAEQQGALPRAGRAKVEDLTREGTEVLGSAIGVGAAAAGHPLGIVDGQGDALQAGVSQPAGVVGLEAGSKLGEVAAEQPLQRVGAPLSLGSRWCRLQPEGRRICHTAHQVDPQRLPHVACVIRRVGNRPLPAS